MPVSDILVDSPLDIGKNMNLITGIEKKDFYEDQKRMRACWLSKEIDDKFEQERQTTKRRGTTLFSRGIVYK